MPYPTYRFDLSRAAPLAPQNIERLQAHGHVREDPWHWLRHQDDPAVLDYLKAENDYTAAVLAPLTELRKALYDEMLARIEEDDSSVPVKLGDWMYYSRTEREKAYPVHVRKRIIEGDWQSSPEEVLLDENVEATGHSYFDVGDFEVSPDGRFLAWTEDTRGNRQYRLRVREITSGKLHPLKQERVSSLTWANDNATLFCTVEDAKTHRANELWRLQCDGAPAVLLLSENDERFALMVSRTRSGAWLMLTAGSHTTNELRLLPADQPLSSWQLFKRRRAGIEYELDHHTEAAHFLLRINDTGPNFRIVALPESDWKPTAWREVMAHDDEVVIEGIDLWRDWLVLSLRIRGLQTLRVAQLATQTLHDIAFSEPAHSVALDDLPDWASPFLRYEFESFTTPDSTFDYAPTTQTSTCIKRTRVLGEFDPARYVSERIEAIAKDGTRIPISLVRHRDTPAGSPLWLEGYGAYGIASDPWFSSTRLSLLDRGWVYALAHVRGGGELGQRWHDGGRLANKRNSFSDYIACAEALIARGDTAAGRILAHGGSAGGLLIGAVLNQRPELFGAAVLDVPFVDVVTTMLDPDLPLTVGEYEEWGNPQRAADYKRMLAYSPYDQLKAQAYPPLLIEAGLHDSQVMYWEPAKYLARLRHLGSARAPSLMHTNLDAGHGGASGRYDQLQERARQIAFALAAIQNPAD